MKRYFVLLALLCGVCAAADEKLVSIFDGKTLNGWKVCQGYASYRVEDGTIVGKTAKGSPNSFLCTTREYGDFILEFDAMTDPALNSGVQIRSHHARSGQVFQVLQEGTLLQGQIFHAQLKDGKLIEKKMDTGRVYGPQIETANDDSGTSGGIWDEARRRMWLNSTPDEAAKKAYKRNEWNHYRVVAVGDSMKVWLNGVLCADVHDPMDQTGFLGLQVHAYTGEKPLEARWRNIRIQDLGRHVWMPLSDGKTFEGWSKRGGGTWTIEDGAFHAKSIPGNKNVGYLVSDRSFKDFTVRVRVRIPQGNSGFFVRADKETLAAYEVELDANKRTGGFWETGPGGRGWVIGPEDNSAVVANGWSVMTASLHGHRIVFHVNGVKTVDLPNDAQGRLEGHIALQVHGKFDTDVWFKDVAILVPEK
ncbi:MAG: DUF1080 domain-containing protein [Bryobacteraceae bacterium]